MNFCGADYDVHFDQATNVSGTTLCGPCVKEETLDSVFSDDECDSILRKSSMLKEDEKKSDSEDSPTRTTPPLHALQGSSNNATLARSKTVSTVTLMSTNRRFGRIADNSTPSPIYLNPMTPDHWEGKTGNSKMNILCPTLEPLIGCTTEKLLERFHKGFHVTVRHEGSTDPASLYLDEEKNLICLKGVDISDTRPWCKLPVDKILRLELAAKGREVSTSTSTSTSPQCSFTMIVNQNSRISYYDFEVDSSIERELIVSTLMVVLDRKKKKMKGKPKLEEGEHCDDFDLGRTEAQPIPCSPSLENQLFFFPNHDAEFSPSELTSYLESTVEEPKTEDLISLEYAQEDRAEHQLKIRKKMIGRLPHRSKSCSPQSQREKLFRQASEGYGSIDHPIDTAGPPATKSKSRLRQSTQDVLSSPRSSPFNFSRRADSSTTFRPMAPVPESMAQAQDIIRSRSSLSGSEVAVQSKAEDLIVEFASSGHLSSPWCPDDTCTLALKDIADTCSNIFALSHPQVACSMQQQRMLEEYIASALGAPSAFYTYLTELDRWKQEVVADSSDPTTGVNARVRNRSSVLNAQARRLRRLRGEMTFSAALKQSQEVMPYVQTTKSFNDEKVYRKQTKQVAEAGANHFHSSSLLQHVVGTMELTLVPSEEDKVAYYDSDPEDARTHSLYKKCPRQVAAEYKNQKNSSSKHETAPKDTGFGKVKSIRRVSKKLEEDVIVQIVQTMTNDRMTLIWHPTKATEGSNHSPLCVKVWIESGVCLLDGTFVLPKLSWTRVLDKNAEQDGAKPGRMLPQTEPYSVDLLDICRVYAAGRIDRKCHPFADARNSFFVDTQSESLLFESLTTEERDRLVYGLKLVIARLASMLMLRDARAAEEFFGAVAPCVPGEAPEWTQGGSHKERKKFND